MRVAPLDEGGPSEEEVSHGCNKTDTPVVDDLLYNLRLAPLSFQDLREFMMREQSEENVDFWQDAENFRQTFMYSRAPKLVRGDISLSDSKQARIEIVEKYLAINAPSEVNIPGDMRLETLNKLESEDLTLFDAPQSEVKFLIELDVFPRFLEYAIRQNITVAQSFLRIRIGAILLILSVVFALVVIILEESGVLETPYVRIGDFVFILGAVSYYFSGKTKV